MTLPSLGTRTRLPAPGPRRGRATPAAALGLGLLVLAALPLMLAPFAMSMVTRILVFAVLAVSLDLLVGIAGIPSLGQAGYFGVGAYAAGWVSLEVSPEAPLPVLVGLAAGALAAAATGWLAVRTPGVFCLMLTLAIGEILQQAAETFEGITGGANGMSGIPSVRWAGTPLVLSGYVYWYVLAWALVAFGVVWAVARSPFGAALRGIRDNDDRMRAIGYPTRVYRYAVFVLSGGVAGLAGGLLVAQQRLVTPADLGFVTAAFMLLAVTVGGAGSLWGAVVGAAVVIGVRDALGPSLQGHGTLVLGLVFVAVVYALPGGVAGLPGTLRRLVRGRRRVAAR